MDTNEHESEGVKAQWTARFFSAVLIRVDSCPFVVEVQRSGSSLNLRPAFLAEFRLRRTLGLARTAGVNCLRCLMADHQIADVRNPGEQIGEDEHRVAPENPVGEQAA